MAIKWTVKDVIDAFNKAMTSTPQDGNNQLLQQLKARQPGMQLGMQPSSAQRTPMQPPVRR